MLRYAKDNYVRITNMDNTMTEFFDSIEDYDAAAEWLSKYSFKEGGKMPLSVDFSSSYKFLCLFRPKGYFYSVSGEIVYYYFARNGVFMAFRAK